MEKIVDLSRQGGTLCVVCPVCGRRHFGNALEYLAETGGAVACDGCETVLKIRYSSEESEPDATRTR